MVFSLDFFLGEGCSRTHFVDQTGFKLTEIHLPLSPESWD